MNACASVPMVCPALRVPGIMASLTHLVARKIAVVVANDPMPRVSKNSVTMPVSRKPVVGRTEPSFGKPRTRVTT